MKKMLLDTIADVEYKLIGINASIEAYKIVFLINSHLKTRFKRTSFDVEMHHKTFNISFLLYAYSDHKTASKIYFVQNKSKYIDQNPKFVSSLFGIEEQQINTYLINSHKQCDYFIKIEDEFDRFKIKKMIHDLNEIPQIISAYEINVKDLKTPQHLIFD
jgi:glycyl-tRNA synthetase (class II)